MKKSEASENVARRKVPFRFQFSTFIFQLAALLLLVGLVSCDNFMHGSNDFKEKLEQDIEYAESTPYEIRMECDEGFGSITSISIISKKVTDQFNVEFKIASGVQFVCWKAYSKSSDGTYSELSSDYIDFISYNTESNDGVYKATVKFVKAAVGIVIKPYCQILPKVESEKITPKFESFGCEQDTTIKIPFNKAVDESTFENILNFTNVSINGADGSDFKKYYENPSLIADSDGNSILIIQPKKPATIITDEETVATKDITISIDFTGAKDTIGLSFVQAEPYTFRVNKNTDNVAPILTGATLLSTEDKTSEYYKELTDKDFDSWSDTENGSFTHGDFSQNHVGGKIYFELCGSDAGGGVAAIQVAETYFRTIAGAETTDTAHTYQVDCEEGDGIYSATYQIHTSDEGVVKLDFALVDYSGNVSGTKTFYVIKDTVIDSKALLFEENKQPSLSWNKDIIPYYGIRKVNGNVDTVTLTEKDTTVDKFYSSYTESFDIEVWWGYSQSELSNLAVKTTNSSGATVYTFDRNYTKLTYVKATFTDNCGNTKTNIRAIPPILDFDMNCVTKNPKQTYNEVIINPYDIQSFQQMCAKIGAKKWTMYYSNMPWWFNHEQNFCYEREIQAIAFYKDQRDKYQGFSSTIYVLGAFEYADGSFWSAPLSVTGLKFDFASDYDDTFDKITMSIDGKPATTAGDSSYINTSTISSEMMAVKRTGVQNSGNYKVQVTNYKNKNVDTTGVKYIFKCVNRSTNEEFISSDNVFYVPTNASYYLRIITEDSAGKKYTSDNLTFRLHGTNSSHTFFSCTKDLTPPNIPSEREDPYDLYNYDGYKLWFNSTPNSFTPHCLKSDKWSRAFPIQDVQAYVPTDDTEMYANSEGLGEIEYFFIPNYGTSTPEFGSCSEEEFEAHEKKIATYDLNQLDYKLPQWQNRTTNNESGVDESTFKDSYRQMRIELPYDGLEEGFYTVCIKAKDASGNYSYGFAPAINKTLGKHLDWTFDSSDNTMTFTDDTYQHYTAMLYYYDTEHSRWVSFYGLLDSTAPNLSYRYFCEYLGKITEAGFFKNRWARIIAKNGFTDLEEAGFFDVEYVYLDYHRYKGTSNAIVCKKKNCLEGLGGIQVFCDKPVFAHTMYCSKRLTQNNSKADATVWENKGIETGLLFESSDFTYGTENYDKIPSGYYYTTIVHFADGTVLMSDVKQK